MRAIFLLLLCSGLAAAQPVTKSHVELELLPAQARLQPGGKLWVALRLKPDSGWHTYWRNPGDSGLATKLTWKLPAGFRAGKPVFATPERFDGSGGVITYGYPSETYLWTEITAPERLPSGPVTLQTNASWLACSEEVCVPGSAALSVKFPAQKTLSQAQFDRERARLPARLAKATAKLSGSDLLLQFALDGVTAAEFFPDGELVEPADTQKLSSEGSRHTLSLKPGGTHPRLTGLLRVTRAGRVEGYEVDVPVR